MRLERVQNRGQRKRARPSAQLFRCSCALSSLCRARALPTSSGDTKSTPLRLLLRVGGARQKMVRYLDVSLTFTKYQCLYLTVSCHHLLCLDIVIWRPDHWPEVSRDGIRFQRESMFLTVETEPASHILCNYAIANVVNQISRLCSFYSIVFYCVTDVLLDKKHRIFAHKSIQDL